jgi:5-methylcytosine-specific restriction enzyme A
LAILEREPLCRRCAAAGRVVAATEVDHIHPKRAGGPEAFDNLQPLCKPCHSAKTAREMGGAR